MGKQNGRAETEIKPSGDASKVPGSAAPALTECRCSVVLPPPPEPWGEGSNWGQAAEDSSRRVVLSSSGHDSGAGLAFPSSFHLHTPFEMVLLWPQLWLCWQCLPFIIYSNFSCLPFWPCVHLVPLVSPPLHSPTFSDPKICDRQRSNTLVNATGKENDWPWHCLSSFLSFLISWEFLGLSESCPRVWEIREQTCSFSSMTML